MTIQYLFAAILFACISINTFAQEQIKGPEKYTATNKGKIFVSWGGNRESFSESDITFRGDDYHFTLYDVVAHDKPKGYHIDYINPGRMTIPQTNFRIGYFVNNNYSIALALDHIKYVKYQDREVTNNEYYPNPGSYGEVLPDDKILLTEDFLTFEHTDGLNYINTEFSRYDDISSLFKINNTDKIQINLTEGISGGILYPKTNAKLLGNDRHDDFHVSGFGAAIKAGLNITFFKHFYLQTELKTGYINMQDIRTTKKSSDKAYQDFFFFQRINQLGGIFRI